MAIGGFEMELLMTKLDYLQDKLQEVEQTMKSSLKSVEASEASTRTKLEELKDHLMLKIDHIQETSLTELKKLEENKEILDILTNLMPAPVRSCRQVTKKSGTYLFRLWKNSKPFEVFCEQNKFEGGWTVIQHRFDGSVDFYRNWTEYRNGFGNVNGEFWLGLEYVHQITKNRPHELLVEMKDFHGNYGYAKYDEFEIGDESELYVLKKLGTYSGTAGDSMTTHKNHKFSTFDRDNDSGPDNCAKNAHGAWRYTNCLLSNLNGRYHNTRRDGGAMVWYDFKKDVRGLSYSRMMIRGIIN
ncbi:fibrinogen-like protein A [Anopheles ziemanni]|uniref:fibrinogen-like protein A n=1 Tax=Anopheles coustani TaxID=139045 RepID=UPI002658F7DF|nr:fibrinogen-like protein A [Anopheles coustani]XP_058178978.1 fibrinogen-like protein A [Anopheles ziemanni]